MLSLTWHFRRAMRDLRQILVFHPALWVLMALQSLVIVVWIAVDPRISFSLANGSQIWLGIGVCLLVAIGISYRFPSDGRPAIAERTRTVALGLVFMLMTFTGIRLLNYLSMSLAFPLADDRLDSWDKALGIDWYAYASGLGQYPMILPLIELPYMLTLMSVVVLFVALTLLGKTERVKEFITLLYMGALVTVCISGFFPAEAAMVRNMDDHLLAAFGPNAGVYHMETLKILREAKEIVLSFADLPGLATFPSFHTMVALLIVYASRDNLFTLLLAGIWSGAMLLATPVYGGHYFIDIIAGAVVAIALAAAYVALKAKNISVSRMVDTTA